MKKKVAYLFSAVFLSFLLGACAEQTTETDAQKEEKANDVKEEQTTGTEENEAEEAHAAQWSYDEDTGPEQWGKLDNANLACINGSEQSPINIGLPQ